MMHCKVENLAPQQARRVGVSVPRTVTIERLPQRIVEIVPEYADYSYFVLDDGAIVIVDPATYDVVYVIEA